MGTEQVKASKRSGKSAQAWGWEDLGYARDAEKARRASGGLTQKTMGKPLDECFCFPMVHTAQEDPTENSTAGSACTRPQEAR